LFSIIFVQIISVTNSIVLTGDLCSILPPRSALFVKKQLTLTCT